MINLIIDRVGNVNVFNYFGNNSNQSESHLQSKMDEDLIAEYTKEIENIAKISLTLQSNLYKTDIQPDILRDLKNLGKTFFDQFFPEPIIEKIKFSNEKFIHFNIDQGLSNIPWELLYDGSCFLSDKFYIGKTVKGASIRKLDDDQGKLKMIIIADPTEDLEWAQNEGEALFKVLKQKISPGLLDLQFISGKQITKLKLLSLIRDRHIIHYTGHLYFSEEALENGWLLSDDKVLKAREIKNCGVSTNLVFSNSCQSSKSTKQKSTANILNYFADSFLMSGINSFIGTNWELVDSERTRDFTIRFYLELFNEKSVGEALYSAREYARRNYPAWDLTWANYTLHGSPDYIVASSKVHVKHRVIDVQLIKKHYPTPIAKTYMDFLDCSEKSDDIRYVMNAIIYSFEELSRIIGCITLSDSVNQSLGNNQFDFKGGVSLLKWWDVIYFSIWNFKKLEISMIMENLMEILSTNREVIFRMIEWVDKFKKGEIETEFLHGYLITFQYYYENLLIELNDFKTSVIIYLQTNSDKHYIFEGEDPGFIFSDLIERVKIEKGKMEGNSLILYNKLNKKVVPLKCMYVKESINSDKLELLTTFAEFS